MAPDNVPGSANLQWRDSGGHAIQNFSTVLQQIFNSDTPILPAPLTDAEAMARAPAASVLADSLLQNYTMGTTTTPANGPGAYNRSYLEAEPVGSAEPWLDTVLLVLQATIMISIIVAAIFGNLLVIASVMRVRKLR